MSFSGLHCLAQFPHRVPIIEMWFLAPFLCREEKHGAIRFFTCSKTAQTPPAEFICHTVIRILSAALPVVSVVSCQGEDREECLHTRQAHSGFLRAGKFQLQSTLTVSERQHICIQKNVVRDTFRGNVQDAWNDLQKQWPIPLKVLRVSTFYPMKILSSFKTTQRHLEPTLTKCSRGQVGFLS